MNLPDTDLLQANFERSFGRLLKLWSSRIEPPRNGRARLMASAREIQNQKVKTLQNLLYHHHLAGTHPRELAILFYAPQMSYITALINF